jgi:uncharacterized membrane protein HdeD (DUF308 family)
MQCNIDQRGRRVRLIYGILNVVLGLVLALAAARGHSPWLWLFAAVLLAGGAFAIFESRKGWCVVRAMGFKTPV